MNFTDKARFQRQLPERPNVLPTPQKWAGTAPDNSSPKLGKGMPLDFQTPEEETARNKRGPGRMEAAVLGTLQCGGSPGLRSPTLSSLVASGWAEALGPL